MKTTRLLGWLLATTVALAAVGCADEVEPVEKDLRLRVFNADSSDSLGFPASVRENILEVRARIYQNGVERIIRTYEYLEPSGRLPKLEFGENYQIVVEALDFDGNPTADGATPLFDYLEESNVGEIQIFVSPLGAIQYASALYVFGSDVVSAPSEFEGRFVAESLGLDLEAFGGQRAGHTATELSDGRIVVIGGARMTSGSGLGGSPFARFFDTVEVYDPFTGYWSLLRDRNAEPLEDAGGGLHEAPMQLSVPRAFHSATLLDGDRILVAGGFADVDSRIDAVSAAEIIDVRDRTIEVIEPGVLDLLEPRALHSAHLIRPTGAEPMVVLVGGVGRQFDRPSFLSGIEAYYLNSGFFDRVVDAEDPEGGPLSLAVGRGFHSGTTLPDGILVAGGRSDQGITPTVEFLETYEGSMRRFFPEGAQLPQLATARFGHTAVLMDQNYGEGDRNGETYVAIAGGFTGVHPDGDAAFTLLDGAAPTTSIEFFDTFNLAIVPEYQRDMATPRAHFAMVETSITRDLMMFGGVTPDGVGNSVERFIRTVDGGFPLTGTTVASGTNHPRAFMPGICLQTHNVMVIGGWDGGSSTTACGTPGALVAGCTSELANPGDLFNLGYLY